MFAIGLAKTGTSSLNEALARLGWHTIHFPTSERLFEDISHSVWHFRDLDECDGFTDITVAPYYAQLADEFPTAKFILTVRDKASWIKSFVGNCARAAAGEGPPPPFSLFQFAAVYGIYIFEPRRFSYVYDQHVRNVKEFFASAPERLLVLDISAPDARAQLCTFLGVPAQPGTFPRCNVAPKFLAIEPQPDSSGAQADAEMGPACVDNTLSLVNPVRVQLHGIFKRFDADKDGTLCRAGEHACGGSGPLFFAAAQPTEIFPPEIVNWCREANGAEPSDALLAIIAEKYPIMDWKGAQEPAPRKSCKNSNNHAGSRVRKALSRPGHPISERRSGRTHPPRS